MHLRAPTLLWRMLLSDVVRLLVLSAAGLTGVVAFAAAVRPLADGKLGPAEALKFMALSIVPMLQLALPFAAGFSATLAYHRFATDNESAAARAGGVGHASALVPAATTGVLLALVVAALSHQVIPRFLRAMQELVTQDVARLLVRSVEQGRPVELGGAIVHADDLFRVDAGDRPDVVERFLLRGVLAIEPSVEDPAADAEPNSSERIAAEIAAEQAHVWLMTDQQDSGAISVVRMRLEGAMGRQEGGVLADVGGVWVGPWMTPDAFDDNPKFYSFTALNRLAREPDRLAAVSRLKRRLAAAAAEQRTHEAVLTALQVDGRLVLRDLDERTYVLRAPEIEALPDGAVLRGRGGEPVEIDTRLADGGLRRQTARRATVRIETDPDQPQTAISLEAEDISVRDEAHIARERLLIEQLRLPRDPAPALHEVDAEELLRRSRADADDPDVAQARRALQNRIDELRKEVVANHHERFALSAACLVMPLLGGVMALRLRDAMPLQVYLWSFFPALATVITISGGENLASERPAIGFIVLWGGVAALAAYTLMAYARLRRR